MIIRSYQPRYSPFVQELPPSSPESLNDLGPQASRLPTLATTVVNSICGPEFHAGQARRLHSQLHSPQFGKLRMRLGDCPQNP